MPRRLASACLFVLSLPVAPFADAAIYTVGANGTHATIQGAIDAAVANPGDDEVRIHTGTFAESIYVGLAADALAISGGWVDGYATTAPAGGASTKVRPAPDQHAFILELDGGSTTFSRLDVGQASVSDNSGAAMRIALTGAAQLVVTDTLFDGNASSAAGLSYGGAIEARIKGTAHVTFDRDAFVDNATSASGADATARGAALILICTESAHCTVTNSRFTHNRADAGAGTVLGAALDLTAYDTTTTTLSGNTYERQEAGAGTTYGFGLALYLEIGNQAQVNLIHESVHSDSGAPAGATGLSSVQFNASNDAIVTIADSLVAQSSGSGIVAFVGDAAFVNVSGLTVADALRTPVLHRIGTSATIALANSLFWNPAAPAHAQFDGVAASANLVGTDPLFLAPVDFDYSLRPGSPALDAGSNDAQLQATDIAGAPRVLGGTIDIGAWESSDRVFAERFER